MCGTCLYDPTGKFSESDQALAFVKQLDDICTMIAHKSAHREFERRIPLRERKNICFAGIWTNLFKIFKARNPFGLAHTIADRALCNEERKKYNWNDLQTLEPPSEDNYDGKKDEDANTALEDLSHKDDRRRWRAEDNGVRVFPGVKLLWTHKNIKRFMELAREAMKKLPSWPFSHALAIEYRCGLHGGPGRGREVPWHVIAEILNDAENGRPVTERQVRYAVTQSLSKVRDHILSHLTPDLGEATKK
jgi:hypothetical protein